MPTAEAIGKLKLIQGGKSNGDFPVAFAVVIVAGVLVFIIIKNMEMPDAART